MSSVFGASVPGWARWLVAGTAALLFSMLLMHTGWLARTLLTTNFSGRLLDIFNVLAPPLFFFIVMLLLLLFAGFTFASLYGGGTTMRGGAVGLLVVGLFASLGAGWQIAHSRANDATELWHLRTYGDEVFILRETLLELADRETEGFPQLELTVVVDDRDIERYGVLAWMLRDFTNVRYVNDPAEARTQRIVIAPLTQEAPELRGNYVGQSLVISRQWEMASMALQDIPAWWFQRKTRVPAQPDQEIVLWLRQDVYDGVDLSGLR